MTNEKEKARSLRAAWEWVRTLCGYYGAQRLLLVLDLIAVVLRAGARLLIPAVALRVFQVYLPEGDLRATGLAALAFAGLAVGAAALDWCGTICGQWLGTLQDLDVTAILPEVREIESIGLGFFSHHRSGIVFPEYIETYFFYILFLGGTLFFFVYDFLIFACQKSVDVIVYRIRK